MNFKNFLILNQQTFFLDELVLVSWWGCCVLPGGLSCNLAAAEFCYLKLMRSSRLLQGLALIQGTYANSQNKGHFNSLAAAHIGEG